MMLLYHGTRRPFRSKGGLLLPRAHHGGAGSSAPTNSAPPATAVDWCYGTEDVLLAWAYAWAAPGRGKPRVLLVQPFDVPTPDPEHSPAMRAWRFGSGRVVDILTDSPITEAEARQGWEVER